MGLWEQEPCFRRRCRWPARVVTSRLRLQRPQHPAPGPGAPLSPSSGACPRVWAPGCKRWNWCPLGRVSDPTSGEQTSNQGVQEGADVALRCRHARGQPQTPRSSAGRWLARGPGLSRLPLRHPDGSPWDNRPPTGTHLALRDLSAPGLTGWAGTSAPARPAAPGGGPASCLCFWGGEGTFQGPHPSRSTRPRAGPAPPIRTSGPALPIRTSGPASPHPHLRPSTPPPTPQAQRPPIRTSGWWRLRLHGTGSPLPLPSPNPDSPQWEGRECGLLGDSDCPRAQEPRAQEPRAQGRGTAPCSFFCKTAS